MAAIKVENYRAIADFYASAQEKVAGVSDYYYQAAEEIVMLQAFDPELDLLGPFYNAYMAARLIFANPPGSIISAVRVLQEHVLSRARTTSGGRFSDINDWIDAGDTNGTLAGGNGNGTALVGRQDDVATSFKVSQEFADLSAKSGYAIDAGNIE